MAISQKRSKRKPSGGLIKRKLIKKKLANNGRSPTLTKVGPNKYKKQRVRGGNNKFRILSTDVVNLAMEGKVVRAKIEDVIDNKANKNYVRSNIITKGAIVKTDKGKAKITSRPGQEKVLSAVLVE